MNFWLRMRVATQGALIGTTTFSNVTLTFLRSTGFTLIAMSWSMNVWPELLPAFNQKHPGWLGPLPDSAAGIVEGSDAQKLQFEQRMRQAEEAHQAEAANSFPPAEKIVVRSNKQAQVEVPKQSGGWSR